MTCAFMSALTNPLEVLVARVQQKDVPVYREWIGTLDGDGAAATVLVLPQPQATISRLAMASESVIDLTEGHVKTGFGTPMH